MQRHYIRRSARGLFRCVLAAVLAALLWTLFLPLYVDVLLALLTLCAAGLLPLLECTLMFTGIAVGIGVLALAAPLYYQEYPFYREHEKYSQGLRYAPNVVDTIEMPCGDLASLDPYLARSVREPRTVHFKTDSRGFRDDEEFGDQHYVLAGDSFIVGNGTDQADTLSSVLQKEFDVRNYSVAFPGDPADYYRNLEELLHEHPASVRAGIFFYEGNDFFGTSELPPKKDVMSKRWAAVLDGYDKFRAEILGRWPRTFRYSKFIYQFTRRLESEVIRREDHSISVYDIGAAKMAFLDDHSTIAMAPSVFDIAAPSPSLMPSVACAFLIPTKFRVYREWLPPALREKVSEVSPSVAALQKIFDPYHIPVVDLTPLLVDEARKLLPENKYVYWRDDSHWNGNGTRSVGAAVARCLRVSPNPHP